MNSEYIKVFRAFTDESRVRVLELLRDGEECACVLLDDLKISQPTLSHHMKILCDSGIVSSRRVGKWNYYSINKEGCQEACRLIDKLRLFENVDKTVRFMTKIYSVARPIRRAFGISGENSTDCENICCCTAAEKNGKYI